MTDTSDSKRDFFVSFNQADRAWATWIAWVLEEAGYSVFFQDWDFKGNFVLEMNKAHAQSRRTIAVLSPDYLTSRFTAPEWAARWLLMHSSLAVTAEGLPLGLAAVKFWTRKKFKGTNTLNKTVNPTGIPI